MAPTKKFTDCEFSHSQQNNIPSPARKFPRGKQPLCTFKFKSDCTSPECKMRHSRVPSTPHRVTKRRYRVDPNNQRSAWIRELEQIERLMPEPDDLVEEGEHKDEQRLLSCLCYAFYLETLVTCTAKVEGEHAKEKHSKLNLLSTNLDLCNSDLSTPPSSPEVDTPPKKHVPPLKNSYKSIDWICPQSSTPTPTFKPITTTMSSRRNNSASFLMDAGHSLDVTELASNFDKEQHQLKVAMATDLQVSTEEAVEDAHSVSLVSDKAMQDEEVSMSEEKEQAQSVSCMLNQKCNISRKISSGVAGSDPMEVNTEVCLDTDDLLNMIAKSSSRMNLDMTSTLGSRPLVLMEEMDSSPLSSLPTDPLILKRLKGNEVMWGPEFYRYNREIVWNRLPLRPEVTDIYDCSNKTSTDQKVEMMTITWKDFAPVDNTTEDSVYANNDPKKQNVLEDLRQNGEDDRVEQNRSTQNVDMDVVEGGNHGSVDEGKKVNESFDESLNESGNYDIPQNEYWNVEVDDDLYEEDYMNDEHSGGYVDEDEGNADVKNDSCENGYSGDMVIENEDVAPDLNDGVCTNLTKVMVEMAIQKTVRMALKHSKEILPCLGLNVNFEHRTSKI